MNVFLEACEIVLLDEVHALSVKLLDSLPNLPSVLVVVGEVKFLPPVTKVS